MREQITLTRDIEQPSIRELSLDETVMVGGGFGPHINWGKIEHKASSIAHTAVSNVKSHNWHEVESSAKSGGTWGGLVGGTISAFGAPEVGAFGPIIGALAGADYALARQDGLV